MADDETKTTVGPWQVLESKYNYRDRWLALRSDTVRLPNGRVLDPYHVIEQPDWVTAVTVDGQPAMIEHDAGAEAAAAQQLRDTGLSSLQSNSSWRFLLNLKAKESGKGKTPDRWFPDPGRVPTDAFWHQFRGEMVAKLEELGWSVIVDENVGHRVFDADPER